MAVVSGYLAVCIAIDNIFEVLQVLITIATLMEAQCPIEWYLWSSNHLLVLLDHLLRAWAKKHIEIQNTCNVMAQICMGVVTMVVSWYM